MLLLIDKMVESKPENAQSLESAANAEADEDKKLLVVTDYGYAEID